MESRTLSRSNSFRQVIADTTAGCEPDELLDRIAEAHTSVVKPLEAQIGRLDREARGKHAELRRRSYMLSHIEAYAVRELHHGAESAATIAHQGEVLGRVRSLVSHAREGNVRAADLAAVLEAEIPLPHFQPAVLAFVADDRFASGEFRSYDGAVSMFYTFVGWTLVATGPGRGMQVQPTFLVGDEGALPQSAIEMRKGLTLQQPLTPALREVV
jgi:hypothetical protein